MSVLHQNIHTAALWLFKLPAVVFRDSPQSWSCCVKTKVGGLFSSSSSSFSLPLNSTWGICAPTEKELSLQGFFVTVKTQSLMKWPLLQHLCCLYWQWLKTLCMARGLQALRDQHLHMEPTKFASLSLFYPTVPTPWPRLPINLKVSSPSVRPSIHQFSVTATQGPIPAVWRGHCRPKTEKTRSSGLILWLI